MQLSVRPISAQWLCFNPHSNQGLIRLIKSKLGLVCFPNKPSLLSLPSLGLTYLPLAMLVACSLITQNSPLDIYAYVHTNRGDPAISVCVSLILLNDTYLIQHIK